MDPRRLDTGTNVYPQIISSNLSYKSPVILDQVLDFVIMVDTPKLDIYFSNQEDLSIAILTEQFSNTLSSTISVSTNASIFQSSDHLQIGTVAIECQQGTSHSLLNSGNIPALLLSLIHI